MADLASARETVVTRQRRFRLEEPCGDVAFDWLRSSALIHLAALQLRRLPAGIDPLAFDAGRPHQRCERRFACALSIARRSRSSISSFKCPPGPWAWSLAYGEIR
jgi:hypothetical protein